MFERSNQRVPLAWKNLTHEMRRLMLAIGGIGFAVLLMCMQLGFQGALLDSTVELPRSLNADLILTNKVKFTLTIRQTFNKSRLYQARALPEVVAAVPFYIDSRFAWKGYGTKHAIPIRVLAFNPADDALILDDVAQQRAKLLIPNTLLFDRLSKSDYGLHRPGEYGEIAGTRMKIVGEFSLGTDFATDGNLLVSDSTYRDAFFPPLARGGALDDVDLGLLKLAKGADADAVIAKLTKLLPKDVTVVTKAKYVASEQAFWQGATPIGTIFLFGTVLGFIVGVIICYQILFADISDHLAEYATLKAMGYPSGYFVGVVLQESLMLSLLGFLPGIAASQVLYSLLSFATGLVLEFTWGRAGLVLVLTISMCVVSGCLTMRKVLTADPAELFR
jgi:putative ABC transport system permease protein